jgi:O-antigen/teichoic acid export membrane protein
MELEHQEKKIIRDISKNFGTNIIARILALARVLIVAKLLGPHFFGIWNGLQIILTYSSYVNFGLTNAMDREYPYYLGKKEEDRAEKLKDTAFSSGLIMSLFFLVIITIVAFFLREKIPRIAAVGLLVMAVASLLQMFVGYYRELFRLDKKIKSVNTVLLLFASIDFIFSVLLVARFKLYALYVSILLSFTAVTVYILSSAKHYFRLRLEPKELWNLIKIGLPLMLVDLTAIAFLTVDKLMILKLLNVTNLGYYGIGSLVTNFILYIPVAIQFVTYPYLLEQYGRAQEAADLGQYLIPPTVFLSFFTPFLIGIILIFIHLPIKYFLSSFLPGLTAIKIIIGGAFFYSLTHLPCNFLIALRKHNKVIQILFLCIILNIILNYIFISRGMGIRGVALGTAISYFLVGTILLGYAVKHLLKNMISVFKFFTRLYLPFIYTMGIFILLNIFVVKDIVTLRDDIQLTTLRLLVFIIFTLPLLFMKGKKLLTLKKIFEKIKLS